MVLVVALSKLSMSFLTELWFVHSFGGLAVMLTLPASQLLLHRSWVQQAKSTYPLPSVYRGMYGATPVCADAATAHGCPPRTVVEAGRGGRREERGRLH